MMDNQVSKSNPLLSLSRKHGLPSATVRLYAEVFFRGHPNNPHETQALCDVIDENKVVDLTYDLQRCVANGLVLPPTAERI